MKTVSIRFSDMKDTTVYLGFVGENLHRRILIDCKKEFEEMPGAVASMVIVPPKGDSYPAVVTVEGNTVMYDVTNSDLIYDGNGEIQLTLTKNNEIGKSARCRTKVEKSLDPTGTTPTPIQNWIEQANAILGGIPDDIAAALAEAKASGEFDGVGIASIQKTGTAGLVDTYTITLTNNQSYDFTVTNGRDGADPTTLIDDESSASNKVWSANKSSLLEEALDDTQDQVAPNYNDLTFPVAKDALCFYEDGLYKAKQAINTAEEWTAAHWEATTVEAEEKEIKNAIVLKTPEEFGAKGDGVTDDSAAVQAAVDAGYEIRFKDNKTYYLASPVTIDHDCHLFGGENTVIKTKSPAGEYADHSIYAQGTLKKTTSLTTDYKTAGSTGCAGNRLAFEDMDGVEIGDLVVITATDQYYSLARQYYYLGATVLIVDKDDDYVYIADAIPWDIENTQNVTVEIYSAPVVAINDLHFVSDIDNPGHYKYCVYMKYCKNAVVTRCTMDNTDNGLIFDHCVNAHVDDVTVSNLPYIGQGEALDHYGISIVSSTNTTIERVLAECGNCAISFSGTIPNLNNRIYRSNLFSSNRNDGVGMHENAYNTVFEDCVIAGIAAYGTIAFNRCRFVRSNKVEDATIGIIYRGSHNPDWARLIIHNCHFDDDIRVVVNHHGPQNPIESFDNITQLVEIINCDGGYFQFNPSTSATILSNRIIEMYVEGWRNCFEIYHTTGNIIDKLIVKDSTFIKNYWLNKHTDGMYIESIKYLKIENTYPQRNIIAADETKGGIYHLKSGYKINFTSEDIAAHCVVCGENIMPNKATDYVCGSVAGSKGSQFSRSVNNSFVNALSVNANNEIVFTQPNNTTKVCTYPICMQYVQETSWVKTSCKIKNTGNTTGASFYIYLAIVDAETGNVFWRNNGQSGQATVDGTVLTYQYIVPAGSLVMAYMYCYDPVANSETTFSEFVTKIMPIECVTDLEYEPFSGSSIIGSGTLQTVDGINNIAVDASSAVSVKFCVDMLR